MGGKGWAHSIAHLADALDESAKNRYTTAAGYIAILETLTSLASLPEPLSYGEDERLAFVALGMMAPNLSLSPRSKHGLPLLLLFRGVMCWKTRALPAIFVLLMPGIFCVVSIFSCNGTRFPL